MTVYKNWYFSLQTCSGEFLLLYAYVYIYVLVECILVSFFSISNHMEKTNRFET